MGAMADGPAVSPLLLPGFEYRQMQVDGVSVSYAVSGAGSPLLFLHGYPENHLVWRDVAASLARDHTVVLADLRGYGNSDKPTPDLAGLVYSKRSMARDQVRLMRALGFWHFQVVSHDRGACVGHRLILDDPDAVTKFAVLDFVPARHVLRNVTPAAALANYHWFFLASGNGIPERMISSDPGFWVHGLMSQLIGEGGSIEPEVMQDYVRCFRDPRTVAASCADYRSALGVDLVHDDEAFAAGHKIECPVQVLWGTQGPAGADCDPTGIWQQYATDVRGQSVPTGHFLPEEAPDLVSAALRDFID